MINNNIDAANNHISKNYSFCVAHYEIFATFAPVNNVEGFGLIATTIKNC